MARAVKKKNIVAPAVENPKFKPGQRVRISEEGVRYKLHPRGTMATVVSCSWITRVQVDGDDKIIAYHWDFWDAV